MRQTSLHDARVAQVFEDESFHGPSGSDGKVAGFVSGKCAIHLVAMLAETVPELIERAAPNGERKEVTVLAVFEIDLLTATTDCLQLDRLAIEPAVKG